jgi:hypothetical protein
MTSHYDDYDVKIELIKRSNDQEKIIGIARNDSDWHVRQFAVAYIDDEEILKDILIDDSITSVSIKAMERIDDVNFLIDVCLNNPFSHIRLATLNRIIDESLLLEENLAKLLESVALNDPNDFIVKSAVENSCFNNQKALAGIARSGHDEEIRNIAVSKITDEETLSDFALNDSNVFTRRKAILNPNLSDFDVLREAIRNDDDEFNRYWACEKITDKDYLIKLIFDESFYPRLEDLSHNSNLDCEDYFKGIYESSDDEYTRLACVNVIRDESFLDDVVLNESDDKIRLEAIKNKGFSNQAILKDLIFSESNPKILFCAVSKISDEDTLVKYIKTHLNDDKATLEAILNIRDIELLIELSKNPNARIRLHAVRSLSNNFKEGHDSILRDIALSDENRDVCLEAARAITDPSDLIGIAEKSSDDEIRILALKAIQAPRLLDSFLFVRDSNADTFFEEKLKSLALDEKDGDVRRIAISKLGDKQTLDRIASSRGNDSRVAKRRLNTLFEDIKRIDNDYLLKKLISSRDSDVSYVARKTFDDLINSQKHIDEINQTSDIERLKSIFNNDFNYYVRCEAEGRLERLLFNIRLDEINEKANQEKFMDIIMDDTFPMEIRSKAFSKINDERFKEDSNKIVLSSREMKCPDCGGVDIACDRLGFYCRDCGLVIHEIRKS